MKSVSKKSQGRGSLERQFKRNEYIKAETVRVVEDGVGFVGIMSRQDALDLARKKGMDLVLISPNSDPPVCKIIEWSKFKYLYSKKKQSSKSSQLREMWLKPLTGKSDLERKVQKIKEFLSAKDRVKVSVRPGKDRRLDKSYYFEQMNRVLGMLEEDGEVELGPKMEGRNLCVIIKPKKRNN